MRASAVFILCLSVVLFACDGPPAAGTRCNDSRDCAADEQCVDGECVLSDAPENTPEPAPQRDGGPPLSADAGTEPADAGPSAEPDSPLDGGGFDGGHPNDDDGGNSIEDDGGAVGGPVAENDFARLSLDFGEVNAGERLTILVEVEDGNRCELSFQNANQALSGGAFENVFVPDADGEVTLSCDGTTEALSLTYRVFDVSIRLETGTDVEASDRHVLHWDANHSSGCLARIRDGADLGSGNAVGFVSSNFQQNAQLEVECDGARENPLVASLLVEDTTLEIDASFTVSDGIVSLQLSLSAPAACAATAPDGDEVPLDIGDAHTIEFEPTEGFVGEWNIHCDTGSGAASATTIVIPQPGFIDAFRVLLSEDDVLQLRWQGTGACELNDVEVPSVGEQLLSEGSGLVVYSLVCQSPTGGMVRRERVYFGDVDLDTSNNNIDAVVGNATLTANDASVGQLSVVVGTLNVAGAILGTPGEVSFSALDVVTGDIVITTGATDIRFYDLVRVGGSLTARGLPNLEDFDLFDLETVEGDFVLEQCDSLSELRATELLTVGGSISVKDLPQAWRVDFRSLTSAQAVSVLDSPALTQVRLDDLQAANAITIENLSEMDDLRLDALRDVSALTVSGSDALEVLEAPDLEVMVSLRITENATLFEIALPNVTEIGTMEIRFNPSLPNSEALQFVNQAGDFITCPNAEPCR